MLASTAILDRFFQHRSQLGHDKQLALTQPYFDLLEKLGNPHRKLPPVFHVAGTNGKGSVCAFLRAILEGAGYRAHVYTSPHLVRFHERIRISGQLIGEEELVELLAQCEAFDERKQVSDFEAATAVAFTAFAKHPADFTILEVGLGGRLDATNVAENKLATIITRLSYDHRDYLGDTLGQIAREKAGIMRENVPCFAAAQPDEESLRALRDVAAAVHAPLYIGGAAWKAEPTAHGQGFRFTDGKRSYDLPPPALLGRHQFENAGLAIAALSVLPEALPADAIIRGLKNVEWPARLQKLEHGALASLLPRGWELWLDGGHNDSAGEVLALQTKAWRDQDGTNPRPLYLVYGMLKTKNPREFLAPISPYVDGIQAIAIPDEDAGFPADELAAQVRATGIENVTSAATLHDALANITGSSSRAGRILICGSLYLAGHVLRANGA